MPLWGYPIGKNYQKRQRLRGAWSAASCTVRGIKSRPLRFFFAVAARAASVIGFLLSCKNNFFRFFFSFSFFLSDRRSTGKRSRSAAACSFQMIFPDVFEDRQMVKICARVAAWCHETTWKYHRDSMVIPCIFRYYCQKNFPGVAENFSQLPENLSGKKNLNMHGITMIFPDVFEDRLIVQICARMAAWRHENTWNYRRDSMVIPCIFR